MPLDFQIILQIAQIICYIVGIVVFIVMIKADVKILKNEIEMVVKRADNHAEKLNILTEAFTRLAVQDNRLKNIEEDIRELKHGKGFITGDDNLGIKRT